MNRGALAFVLLAIGGVPGCAHRSPADVFAAHPEDVRRGRSIFIGTCSGYCHSTSPGPRDAPYLFDCAWRHGGQDEEIFSVIADGVPNTRMVAFGGTLPDGDDDIWRILAYLKVERKGC